MLHTDEYPADLLRLLTTAGAELDLGAIYDGDRAICRTRCRCKRASSADLALGGF